MCRSEAKKWLSFLFLGWYWGVFLYIVLEWLFQTSGTTSHDPIVSLGVSAYDSGQRSDITLHSRIYPSRFPFSFCTFFNSLGLCFHILLELISSIYRVWQTAQCFFSWSLSLKLRKKIIKHVSERKKWKNAILFFMATFLLLFPFTSSLF